MRLIDVADLEKFIRKIDEAIAKHIKIAKTQKALYDACTLKEQNKHFLREAEEHEQLAEWLEELKKIKSSGRYVQGNKAGQKIGYRNAIDDFVKAIVDRGLSANDDKYCITRYDNYLKVIKEIAEQLKEGVNINE